ncbi:LolA family protein [Metabacillus litoralis]|uniref:LolA family protein n=1 Tax=Metabacillus litoralis TaxID=152268 RepID=UPI001CFECD1B|nr:outer membrane lipoprotein-sorting protein [Metabacillus litoralis]
MILKRLLIGTAIVCQIGLLAGCSEDVEASSGDIVLNVLESGKEVTDYYGKATLKMYSEDVETENLVIEEYVAKNGQRKVITTDLNNKKKAFAYNTGDELITFDESTQQAIKIDLSDEDLQTNHTQKEQLINILEGMKNSHTYKVVGEEKINGVNTYHLKATPKTSDSIIGTMEFWVDKKTWFMMKTVTTSGDMISEIVYEKVDTSPNFSDETFKVNLPEGIKAVPLDTEFNSQTGTISEAEKAVGKSILVFPENNVKVESVDWQEIGGEINRTEVNIMYASTEDATPYFLVSVFPTPKGDDMEIEKTQWVVRGHNAEYMEEIKAISWDEDGLRYNVMITNPDLTIEEVIKWTEDMEYQ